MIMNSVGCDVGTFTLVAARRNATGEIEYKKEINAFVEIPLENRYMFNILKKSGAPLIERDKNAFVVGEAALNLSYSMPQITLRRPMKNGCLNPAEKDAFFVMGIMLHSLIGKIDQDKTQLCYTVPANAVNQQSDADYHNKILESIFKKYSVDGKTLIPTPVNEALCIAFAELANKQYTGISVSAGGGMTNVCYSVYGAPVFHFSIINAGDWIDQQAANATGENITVVNREKAKLDLTKQPSNALERAINTQYQIMIEKTISGIKKGIETNAGKFSLDTPVDVVLSGGTSTPNGFREIFDNTMRKEISGIKIGEVKQPKDTLQVVARGALIAAENNT